MMLILDADSLMTGDTIVRLVAAMEQHPRRGADPDAADRGQRQNVVRASGSSLPGGCTAR